MTVQVSRKMRSQLWKLLLLCYLLTGTSAGHFNDLSLVADRKHVLQNGLETVDNTLKGESVR